METSANERLQVLPSLAIRENQVVMVLWCDTGDPFLRSSSTTRAIHILLTTIWQLYFND